MIFAVEERADHDVTSFLFDSDKVDRSKPFEAAYLQLLNRAAASSTKDVTTSLPLPLDKRCSEYQDGSPAWENLKAKMPCVVSESVTVWID